MNILTKTKCRCSFKISKLDIKDYKYKKGGEKMNNKGKNKLKRLFLWSALITLGCVLVVYAGVLVVGNHLIKSVQVSTDYVEYEPKANHQVEEVDQESEDEADTQAVEKKDKKVQKVQMKDKTIMVFGVDKEEARTDTIMVVHFDSKNERIYITSIPRDTKVVWTQEQRDQARLLGRSYQYESKITDMSSLGGIENLRYFTIRSVEEMLDVKVDNYVVVNTSVIREIVDKLGGIEVNVPRVMQYDDYYQDLHIDLQPGLQLLNGQQAEGLLRWRHNNSYSEQYTEGDLGRIETQQLFIKAFSDKVFNDVSVGKIIDVVTAVYSNIKTDVSFQEMLDYINYLPYLSAKNIVLETLPGESRLEEVWYYIVDEEEVVKLVNKQFYGMTTVLHPDVTPVAEVLQN